MSPPASGGSAGRAPGGAPGGARHGAEGLGSAVEALWERFAPLVEARVAVVEAAAGASRDGAAPPSLAEAQAAAHALAGALGSYGRPAAGAVASRIDVLLDAPGPDRGELAALAAELRAALEPPGSPVPVTRSAPAPPPG